MLDLAWLEDDIAIRQDDGRAKAVQPPQDLKGGRIQLVGERVIHEEGGHRQQLHLARVFDAIALEGSDIVAIAELHEQILQNPPIALAGGEAKGALEMVLQVLLDPVIMEQRVVYVDEEDDRMTRFHAALPLRLWRQRRMAGRPRRARIICAPYRGHEALTVTSPALGSFSTVASRRGD